LLLACCGLALGFVVPALAISVTAQVSRHEQAVKLLPFPRASPQSLQPPPVPAGAEPAVHPPPTVHIPREPILHGRPLGGISPGVHTPAPVRQPTGDSEAAAPGPTSTTKTPATPEPTAANTGEPKKTK
jgi:hypothetical protein